MRDGVDEKLKELGTEYDLTDLAVNDRMQLESLAEAYTQLGKFYELLDDEFSKEAGNFTRVKDLKKLISDTLKDISNISDDLKISRKIRESKSDHLPDIIAGFKVRARKFIEDRMSYIYCPKCKTLVGNLYLIDYNIGGKANFVCPHCGNNFIVAFSELTTRKNLESALLPINPT